jgi:hypothetical protein
MSGPVVIVVAAMPALMREPNLVGQAVAWSDPDAHDGRGDAEFTLDPLRAKRFPNAADAMEYWRRQSTIRPHTRRRQAEPAAYGVHGGSSLASSMA